MPNLVTRMIARELDDQLREVPGLLIVAFGGLTVAETEDIRGKLAEKGVGLRMVRNKLARRVLAGRGIELDGDALMGNTAIAYGETEPMIGAAKVLASPEVKKAKKVQFRAALFEGQVLDAGDAAALADMPDRDAMNAMLLGVIAGPARSLATVLQALPASVARVVQARADELEKAQG